MATSWPSTCAHTMVSASTWVGLTLPGMIELPGSLAGSRSSPNPARGPLPISRMSLAIFVSATASMRSAACRPTSASWPAIAANRLSATTNGAPSRRASRAATRWPNSRCVFSPVPTAVPPMASACSAGSAPRNAASASASWAS